MAEDDPLPAAEIPERLDRTMRVGPFPSGREALKFIAYAAVGALLAPVVGAVVWLGFVATGLTVTIWRPEGEGIDTRLLAMVRWRLRAPFHEARPVTAFPRRRGLTIALPSGGYAAVVRTGGLAVAYLPATELRRTFDRFRELLHAIDWGAVVLSTRAPIHASALVPAEPAPVGDERAAREGYRELVEVIVRRRFVRHVYLAILSHGAGPDSLARLDARVALLSDHLVALGLRPIRLRDSALNDAAARMGLVGRPEER